MNIYFEFEIGLADLTEKVYSSGSFNSEVSWNWIQFINPVKSCQCLNAINCYQVIWITIKDWNRINRKNVIHVIENDFLI